MAAEAFSTPIDAAGKGAIRDELSRILASREFRASQRCCGFLSYVVEAVLEGHGDTLKERTIGVEVFARTTEYDPSDDATVRVKAGEVRKRLALYYAGPQGADDQIVIELPLGAYIPSFHHREERSPATTLQPSSDGDHLASMQQPDAGKVVAAEASATLHSEQYWWHRNWKAALSLLTVLVFGGGGILVYRHYTAPEVTPIFNQFWAPVFQSDASALLCVTPVPVYALQYDATPRVEPRAQDFVVVRDQFVAIGDLDAESRIAAALDRAKRPVHIRIGNTPFEELRKSPAILVGYSYSRWKEINMGLRFSIDLDRRPSYAVLDNGVPTAWHITTYPDDPNLKEDYGIITRVFDPDTGQMLVEIAGISHYGTEGAADVLTNPALLAQALHNAPANWQKKNIQIVLHVRVISGTPTAPNVIATYFW